MEGVMLVDFRTKEVHARAAHARDGIDAAQLRSLVERAANIKEQIAAFNSDLSDLYKEAASSGFDKRALKDTVQAFAEDAEKRVKRREARDALATYLDALGLS
jgi:uncharacterized protein (UPF0335 family)